MFIDDNTDHESSELLSRFAGECPDAVHIVSGDAADRSAGYRREEFTHHWDDRAIWKVAAYKNRIIDHCLQHACDALFLVDSDLLLYPETLRMLWDSGKPIVSEIFWTRWQPTAGPLPQVWLRDEYTLFESHGREKLTEGEMLLRQVAFLAKLRIPGVYEVGGLGACTLIRKFALEKGVHFGKIKNLSFWGEDRHFCIRAAAMGLELFVDTHVPAFHIYRETDIQEAVEWMNANYGSS